MKKMIYGLSLGLLLSGAALANNLQERLDLPDWTDGVNIKVAYSHDHLDFDRLSSDLDLSGVEAEVSKDYELGSGVVTTSAITGRITDTNDEFVDADMKAIGLNQRLGYRMEMGAGTELVPSLGVGINYGSIELGGLSDDEFFSYKGEAMLKFETNEGIAPFVAYRFGIADLENRGDDVEVQTIVGGLAAVF